MMSEVAPPPVALPHSVFGRPCLGERVSGDGALVCWIADRYLLAMIDGTGHGEEAHTVARLLERHIRLLWPGDILKILDGLHEVANGTCGAAVGLADLDMSSGNLIFAGVGNTTLHVLGSTSTMHLSQPGVIGQYIRSLDVCQLQLQPQDSVVMHTDGVETALREAFPKLSFLPPRALARRLVKDYGKTMDDATCLVAQYPR